MATALAQPHSSVTEAASVIQRLYSGQESIAEQQRLQRTLFEFQEKSEAWSVIVPFLEHEDANVQFFGAHTAQVKIARDWGTLPPDQASALKDLLLNSSCRSALLRRSRVVLRKLFVAICSLAIRLSSNRPTQWPEWLLSTCTAFSAHGMQKETILDFLAIAVEEIDHSDLIGTNKGIMQASLRETVPLVIQTVSPIISSQTSEVELFAALKCVQAWVEWGLPANDLTPLLPGLISRLSQPDCFSATSDVLQEILSKSSLSDGKGVKVLTEPLLRWIEATGQEILDNHVSARQSDEISHSLCKLLVCLGEHSTSYLATHLMDPKVQRYIRVLLGFTSFPGWPGEDEDESEATLPFWYLLEEALMDADFVADPSGEQWGVAKAVFSELVLVLKRKCTWPPASTISWANDQKEKFSIYRRDVGDALINAYYILRDDAIRALVVPLVPALSSALPDWEDIEAALFCVKSMQEAVPVQANPHLSLLFGPQILGKLPTVGAERVRLTALALIGEYSTWFYADPTLLLAAVGYLVPAITEPALCLTAASALRDLCDANRSTLATDISAFAQLHANLPFVPNSEKPKIIQSIASVIQALSPSNAIQPVEAIVNPIIFSLRTSLDIATERPEEARLASVHQLQALAACAKGLTPASDPVLSDIDETPEMPKPMSVAREDPRIFALRQAMLAVITQVMQLWSSDPELADVLSDLLKSLTCVPEETTLISLAPLPLLELICLAADRQPTAVWLTLAGRMIAQLDPPSYTSLRTVPTQETQRLADSAAQSLTLSALRFLGQPGAMEANPDIVQAFFTCMTGVGQHFPPIILHFPAATLDGLMQCAITSLRLQERYSLVSSCRFLRAFTNRVFSVDALVEEAKALFRQYGRAMSELLLYGIGGLAPRSTIPNLAELLATLVTKLPDELRVWMHEILYSEQYGHPRATPAAKEKFIKAVLSSRSTKKINEAAHEFALVARGLDNTTFGYVSGPASVPTA